MKLCPLCKAEITDERECPFCGARLKNDLTSERSEKEKAIEENVFIIEKGILKKCIGEISAITIPDGVKKIDALAFCN